MNRVRRELASRVQDAYVQTRGRCADPQWSDPTGETALYRVAAARGERFPKRPRGSRALLTAVNEMLRVAGGASS